MWHFYVPERRKNTNKQASLILYERNFFEFAAFSCFTMFAWCTLYIWIHSSMHPSKYNLYAVGSANWLRNEIERMRWQKKQKIVEVRTQWNQWRIEYAAAKKNDKRRKSMVVIQTLHHAIHTCVHKMHCIYSVIWYNYTGDIDVKESCNLYANI